MLADLQWAGILLASCTFATIAIGHGLVRRLHAGYGTRPAVPFFVLGSLMLMASLFMNNDLLSGSLGITGITFAWDGFEIFRQEKRQQREILP